MTSFLRCLPFLTGLALAAPPDMLRLEDGSIEGSFAGIDQEGRLLWNRDDSEKPLEFRTDKIRHIALRGGSPARTTSELSHVTLTNGDALPGHLVAMTDTLVEMETALVGDISIPRENVVSIEPNPFGGRLIYAGPFDDSGWEMITPDTDDPERLEETEDQDATWIHSGAHWYYTGGREAIRKSVEMPDQSVFRFHVDWKSRPPLSIAFLADFAQAPAWDEKEAPEDEADQAMRSRPDQLTAAFGNCLVLSVRPTFASLQHCGYDKDGRAFSRMIRSAVSTVRFEESGQADFELRTDLKKRSATLFVDGAYMLHWDLSEELKESPLGRGIGFLVPGNNEPLRISDILVAEWNGMPDAARSLHHPDRDLVLLTNGTDRFSGKVVDMRDGDLRLATSYAELTIPLDQIAEIQLAGQAETLEAAGKKKDLMIHFKPVGRVTGQVTESTSSEVNLRSPVLGDLKVDLSAACLLEFHKGGRFLQTWDDDL